MNGRGASLLNPKEPHEISGLTTRLILAYAEREGGVQAVEAVLERTGLLPYREELRDESSWFSFATKVALFEATADVLGDPDVGRRIGAAAVELNAFSLLKVMLRAVGTPQFVYLAIPRTGQKFSWTHQMEVLGSSRTTARIRYRDVVGVGYHELDCQYSEGLLACIPTMFGALPARMRHPECALQGAPACIYEARWSEEGVAPLARTARKWAALSAGAMLSSLPRGASARRAAAGVPVMGAAAVARQARRQRDQRTQSLTAMMRDQRALGERLFASLRDLAGELRVEEVLDKIVDNAQATVTGREFVLLVATDQGLHSRSSSGGVPLTGVRAVEAWANQAPEALTSAIEHVALERVPELASLTTHPKTPIGALHSSPLRFRGNTMGALVALAHGADRFATLEVEVLRAYADQAAVALGNARLFAQVEDLARRDSLTGLLNSREFEQEMVRQIRHAERADTDLSVVMLDLDGFKRVNDELGHAEGDRLLRQVADVIAGACEGRGTAHRIGGDEFALVLPRTGKTDAAALAAGIEAGVQSVASTVGVSWGVAVWPEDGPSQNMLTFNADRALYEHKAREGSNRSRAAYMSAELPAPPPGLAAFAGLDPRDHYLRMLAATLARAVDAKDSLTRSHSETVSELCDLIARELGMDEEHVSRVALAGLLHDVGKIGVPDSILKKPSTLTAAEYQVMQTHTTLGHRIVAGADLAEAATWILHHHERIDGGGYPDGLSGEQIPLESRIIFVADTFEAITADRPYRAGRSVAAALAELERHAGTQFDPACVQALRRVLGTGARELFEGPRSATPAD